MKYKINSQVINSDHIVRMVYWEAHGDIKSQCDITLTSISTAELDHGATSDSIVLLDEAADMFWAAYSRDAYEVGT